MENDNCNVEEDALENYIETEDIATFPSEIRAVIPKLKNGKAAGVDSITAEMLKTGDEYLSIRQSECAECMYVRIRYLA